MVLIHVLVVGGDEVFVAVSICFVILHVNGQEQDTVFDHLDDAGHSGNPRLWPAMICVLFV